MSREGDMLKGSFNPDSPDRNMDSNPDRSETSIPTPSLHDVITIEHDFQNNRTQRYRQRNPEREQFEDYRR